MDDVLNVIHFSDTDPFIIIHRLLEMSNNEFHRPDWVVVCHHDKLIDLAIDLFSKWRISALISTFSLRVDND